MRSFKQLLDSGRPLLGTFCALGSIEAVELACHAGLDFVVVDAQHGCFSREGLREAVRAVDAAGGLPVARLPANGLDAVEGLLDAGYVALVAPMVNSAESAARWVTAAYYPPSGLRSQSGCRASLREGAGYPQTFNREFALIVMLETLDAVGRAAEILAVPGVTGALVGPTDLAASLAAAPGAAATTDLPALVAQALAAARGVGKPIGIAARNAENARAYAAQGFAFVVLGTDRRLLQSALEKQTAAWRA
jgi:4-hydroxy-2-oxoheptanedioate aldolase